MKRLWILGFGAACLAIVGCGGSNSSLSAPTPPSSYNSGGGLPPTGSAVTSVMRIVRSSEKLDGKPTDVAIWVHPKDGTKSLAVATVVGEKSSWLVASGPDGKLVSKLDLSGTPVGVDVQYKVASGKTDIDLVAVAVTDGVKFFTIGRTDRAIKAMESKGAELGELRATSVALTKSAKGALNVLIATTNGKAGQAIQQYSAKFEDSKLSLKLDRTIGELVGAENSTGIQTLYTDTAKQRILACDPSFGIREYRSEPKAEATDKEVTSFGMQGFKGSRRGLSAYREHYLVLDSTEEASELKLYPKVATGQRNERLSLQLGSGNAQGVEVTSKASGKEFPSGWMVIANQKESRLDFFDLRDIQRALGMAR